MKHKKNIFIIGACIAALLGTVGIYGRFSDRITVTNELSSGDVNIGISEYAQKNGKEVRYRNPKSVMPGDVISKIPRIQNYGMPCWIRARITYLNQSDQISGLSDQNLSGFKKEWIKRGSYYYYTQILDAGKSTDLFQQVHIPAEWKEAHQEQKLGISIRAEAIQAANFRPDFSSADPWKGEKIQLCVHESEGKVTCKTKPARLSVEFNGEAHRLLAIPKDFFGNFGEIMPGDVLKDQAVISNTTKTPATIYFHTETPELKENQKQFLQKLNIKISIGKKEIYSGNLYTPISNEISLGEYLPGQKETLRFQISAPKDMDNAYSLLDGTVKWIFGVKETDSARTTEDDSDNGNDENGPDRRDSGQQSKNPAKTGDNNPIFWYFVILSSTFTLAARTALHLRKGDKEK